MTTLTSSNSKDSVRYTLDLENSRANFTIESIEILANHLVLVNTMLDRLEGEDIKRIVFSFKSRGGRNIEKIIEEKVKEPVDLVTKNKKVSDKDTEDADAKEDEKEKPKFTIVKKKVSEWKWNNVCYAPKHLDIVLEVRDKNGDCTYTVSISDFMKFYHVNLDSIITRDIMNSNRFDNPEDKDGFSLVRNIKNEKSRFRRTLDKDILALRDEVREECKEELEQLYEQRKKLNEERKQLKDSKENADDDTTELSDLHELERELELAKNLENSTKSMAQASASS